jgi:UDP-N-acetylmuramate: L-alanyl-gamma-D-glutamyl-meso-diaminopimelate ligase
MRALELAKPVARVQCYGETAAVRALDVQEDARGLSFTVVVDNRSRGVISLPLSGQHNLKNALGAYCILSGLGLSHDEIAAGMASFGGVKRRMEVVGEAGGVLVVDDFAHHPTAVATTMAGARKRYAGRQVWALFEPRSATSCRKVFQDDYARAFDTASRVLLAPPGRALDPSIALDVPQLAHDVNARGIPAMAASSLDEMVAACVQDAQPGTVLLCMSNGGFGGIHQKLLAALRERRT